VEGEGEEFDTRWKETTSKTERERQRVCVCERGSKGKKERWRVKDGERKEGNIGLNAVA